MTTDRRHFIAQASALSAAAFIAPSALGARRSSALGDLGIGLVGCGGRGCGAVNDSMQANPNVRLIAMADVDTAKAKTGRDELQKAHSARIAVDDSRIYGGLDGFQRVIETPGVDIVFFAAAPGFRPQHVAAAVAAKKHVFAEKPVCVDPFGYRSCCASHDAAVKQGTAIVTGTQYRRQTSFVEAMRLIHKEKAIGEVVSATARYCSQGIWYRPREGGMSDARYQINNWMHFIWLSGDEICEQAVHNIDVMNWVMGGPPESAISCGGRFTRPEDSEMWDSLAVDFVYPGGKVVDFKCRQWPNATSDVDNVVYGTNGYALLRAFSSGSTLYDLSGKEIAFIPGDIGAAYRQEHKDLVDSITAGKPIVELRQTAESSLTAALGRESGYCGRNLDWKWFSDESQLNLFPAGLTLESELPKPFVRFAGSYTIV